MRGTSISFSCSSNRPSSCTRAARRASSRSRPAKRIPELPDAPTTVELGFPGLISDTWNAISAPPGTPAPIVSKLNATLNEVLQEPELAGRFKQLQLTPGSGNVAETRAFIEEDTKRWIDVINEANIPKI